MPHTGHHTAPNVRRDPQDVLNEAWPDHPERCPIQPGIPVTVRLHFAGDGWTTLPGTATRWDRSHVWVETRDPRVLALGVWVRAGDVRRR